MVGSRFIELYKDSYDIVAPTIEELDFLDFSATRELVKKENPKMLINFAAITNVEGSEKEKDDLDGITYKVNTGAVENLSDIANDFDLHLVHISTEYVFDGEKADGPYTEEDTPNPINWYGKTKYLAEQAIIESGCVSTIIRIAMPYTSEFPLKKDIARRFLEVLRGGEEIRAISDSEITPVFIDDIASALDAILKEKAQGIYHVVPDNHTTPFGFASLIADTFNLNKALIKELGFDEYNSSKDAKLLRHDWMSNKKFTTQFGPRILHTIEESLEEFKKQIDALP